MNDVTAGLSDADLQKFADTIAKLPAPKPPTSAPDAARMQRASALVAQHRCAFCHDGTFVGGQNVPRIASQREDYLLKALRDYKAGARREYRPAMAEVMVLLTDDNLIDLAHFLAHTPAP
jgi:cytochrome c553